MVAIVIDPARLVDDGNFESEVEAMLDYVTQARPADEAAPVLVPGDPERASRAERRANGIPVDDTTWVEILAVAESLGVASEMDSAANAG